MGPLIACGYCPVNGAFTSMLPGRKSCTGYPWTVALLIVRIPAQGVYMPCHRAQRCRQARGCSQTVCAAAAAAAATSPVHGVAWSQLGSMLLGAGVFLLGLAAVILLVAAVPLLLVGVGHLVLLDLSAQLSTKSGPSTPSSTCDCTCICLSVCPRPALVVVAS